MPDYDIHLDDKFGSLELIDIPGEIAAHEPWFNQTLTTVNDSVVRLGIIEGDFHWHKHDVEDEFFLVLEGQLLIDLEDRETVTLNPHQGYTVPRGVMHRTRAPVKTAILMVEPAGGRADRRLNELSRLAGGSHTLLSAAALEELERSGASWRVPTQSGPNGRHVGAEFAQHAGQRLAPDRAVGEHVREHAAVGERLRRLAQRVDERVVVGAFVADALGDPREGPRGALEPRQQLARRPPGPADR